MKAPPDGVDGAAVGFVFTVFLLCSVMAPSASQFRLGRA